jgi:hypothetical protein
VDPDAAADARSKILPDPNVLAKRVGDEIVLVHLETNRVFELNRTAALLWDALAAGPTRAELEEQLAMEFDVERDALAHEIDDLLVQFRSEHLTRSE